MAVGSTENCFKLLQGRDDKTAEVRSLNVLTDFRQALRDRFTLSIFAPLAHRSGVSMMRVKICSMYSLHLFI